MGNDEILHHAAHGENELIEQRKAKLDVFRKAGIDPFGGKFDVNYCAEMAIKHYEEGKEVVIAGRIMTFRDMGKSAFAHIRDQSGRIQIYVQKNVIGDDAYNLFKQIDLGDIVGVKGSLFLTKTGEKSVKVQDIRLLSKALRPPPEKWHGLQDVETKYRQRYLDLMSNDQIRNLFFKRSQVIREIRRFLDERYFVEVETPMMQSIPGGAAAQPFVTHHNALDIDLYLRIAPELYLKRLLVGGFDRVYEINRNFRNEGISRKHNPEFTMLEAYQAFGDVETMMELVESMITSVAEKVFGSLIIEHKNAEGQVIRTINLTRPWKRAKLYDLLAPFGEFAPGIARPSAEALKQLKEHGSTLALEGREPFEIAMEFYEKLVEPNLIDPVFVTHLPFQVVPLARQNPQNPQLVDVYELAINGQEISPGYSELNDPLVQRERLMHQAGAETQRLDEDFLVALEHGMPPAGGLGLGIDRLMMLLIGAESIRDVILFPQMRPRTSSEP